MGKQLVDELKTSDEYLASRAHDADLYQLHYAEKKSLPERFGMAASVALEQSVMKGWARLNEQRFWQ